MARLKTRRRLRNTTCTTGSAAARGGRRFSPAEAPAATTNPNPTAKAKIFRRMSMRAIVRGLPRGRTCSDPSWDMTSWNLFEAHAGKHDDYVRQWAVAAKPGAAPCSYASSGLPRQFFFNRCKIPRDNTKSSAMDAETVLRLNRDEILRIAARRGARNLRIFGSVARGNATPESDIDFLVDMEAGRSLFDLGGLLSDLQQLLGRPVDVVTEAGLRQRIRARVLTEVRPL